jgi:hypothetical protein
MKHFSAIVVIVSLLAGCGAPPRKAELGPVNVVASPYEPAAQLDASARGSAAEGAVIGAAGGAGIGAMSAKASAGLLCTMGGPLCWVVMVPAAIVGGVVGGLAGGAADAITSGPSDEMVATRKAIDDAVARMRFTQGLADRMAAHSAAGAGHTLEVEVTDYEYLAREKDMAVALRARARLQRGGQVLEERFAEARTPYRSYEEWAANDARDLRAELDAALGRLGERLLSASRFRPRADISAPRGG